MRLPKYAHHKPSNRARVRIGGKDHFLGTWESPESKRRYRALIKKWRDDQHAKASGLRPDLTVGQLVELYIPFAETHYRKNGRVTSEISALNLAFGALRETCEDVNAADFGPRLLKATRDAMIAKGWVRKSINKQVSRIRRLFRWATSEELIDVEVFQSLATLQGLQQNRTKAVEKGPVRPVPIAFVETVLPLVTHPVRGLIELQLATGCRPGEATAIRACDITMSGDVWEYRPIEHKTQHHGRGRVIHLGPRAQGVIREFLRPDLTAYLFSPRLAEGANSRAREHYDTDSYGRAIRRACLKAEIPLWSPNQLRHNVGTELRKKYDLETAQTVLGHSKANTTEIYAERDHSRARTAMAEIG